MTKLKERIHRLVDDLPRSELPVAERFLQYLRDAGSDPLLRALASAPYDDEPFTKQDEAAVREADEAVARGDVIPHDHVTGRRSR